MISISDALNKVISSYPFIEEGLSQGIINYSAFARKIKPQIEKKLYKPVTTGAIIMSLKRTSKKMSQDKPSEKGVNLTDLTVRSNLTEFTFANFVSLADKQSRLFNQLINQKDIFCAVSQGIRETTFIASSNITPLLEKIFSGETKVAVIKNQSSITIHLPLETVNTPGIYYQVLKLLAWNNINVTEVISTYTELTIIFNNKDIDRAFSVLKNLK